MLFRGQVTTWRDRLVVSLVCAVFILPAMFLLLGPTPARYSFQMYSGYGVMSAHWQDRGGRTHVVRLGEHIAASRVEVDWTTFLPEELCARIPDAVRVEVRRLQPDRLERRSVAC